MLKDCTLTAGFTVLWCIGVLAHMSYHLTTSYKLADAIGLAGVYLLMILVVSLIILEWLAVSENAGVEKTSNDSLTAQHQSASTGQIGMLEKLMKEQDDIAGLSHVWVLKLFAEVENGDIEEAQNSLKQSIRDRHDAQNVFSNIYIAMGAICLDIDEDPLNATKRLGLLYKLGGENPFIAEWLNPLRDKLSDLFDEALLQNLLKQGEKLELPAVIAEIESKI